MRWKRDEIDGWAEAWANQRRKILGLSTLEPKERVGRLNSTLGQIREEGEGASHGTVNQNFPEVYTGDALLVNRAWRRMRADWRMLMEAHYVWSSVPAKVKIPMLEMSSREYWHQLSMIKTYLSGYVESHREVEV